MKESFLRHGSNRRDRNLPIFFIPGDLDTSDDEPQYGG